MSSLIICGLCFIDHARLIFCIEKKMNLALSSVLTCDVDSNVSDLYFVIHKLAVGLHLTSFQRLM